MTIKSSYALNNYGPVFYETVQEFMPRKAIEIGILHGYSLLHILRGLKVLKDEYQHPCQAFAYDLFEEYEYNHGTYEEIDTMLKKEGLRDMVTIEKCGIWQVHKKFPEELSVDFLHVDISNDGKILGKLVDRWYPILSFGGIIMFEGGSEERDNVKWMKKYNKRPIRQEIKENELIRKKFLYGTYTPFPSLTVLIKKS